MGRHIGFYFSIRSFCTGLPDFSWCNTPNREKDTKIATKDTKMATKYTKLPQKIPKWPQNTPN
jgi:hypothetical protein